MPDVLVPRLSPSDLSGLYGEDNALDLLEYIQMLSLESPRVNKGDVIDPHLSRYDVPDFGRGVGSGHIVLARLKGFMPPSFVRNVFMAIRNEAFKNKKTTNGTQDGDASMEGDSVVEEEGKWFSMSAQDFGGNNSWTVMQFADRQTLTWEIEG